MLLTYITSVFNYPIIFYLNKINLYLIFIFYFLFLLYSAVIIGKITNPIIIEAIAR